MRPRLHPGRGVEGPRWHGAGALRNRHVQRLVTATHEDQGRLALGLAEGGADVRGRAHRCAVDFLEHVADADARVRGRTRGVHVRDLDAGVARLEGEAQSAPRAAPSAYAPTSQGTAETPNQKSTRTKLRCSGWPRRATTQNTVRPSWIAT